jgi:RNA polymerase sigma factor (sigma-70 family)
VELLRFGPRFTVSDEQQFRAFLAQIAENVLRNEHRHFDAARRRASLERPMPNDSVLDLDPRRGAPESPSTISDRREREAWLRLGLELLRPEDREAILLREQQGLPFEEVGAKLGVSANTARMRFERALARLADVVTRLRLEGVEGVTKPEA